MKAKAKYPTHIQECIYSFAGHGGVSVIADIQRGEMFNARKKGKYFFVSRKHLGFQLRFTEMAFKDNFEVVEEV